MERPLETNPLSQLSTTMVAPSRMGGTLQPSQGHEDKPRRGCRAGWRVQQKKEKGTRVSEIYNLSKVTLSQKELNILNAGLKCAVSKPMNKFDVYIDVHRYIRKLSISISILFRNISCPISMR